MTHMTEQGCGRCHGTGFVPMRVDTVSGGPSTTDRRCPNCGGTGTRQPDPFGEEQPIVDAMERRNRRPYG